MVRPYEEIEEGKLSREEFDAIALIVFRNVEGAYKQYRWRTKLRKFYGEIICVNWGKEIYKKLKTREEKYYAPQKSSQILISLRMSQESGKQKYPIVVAEVGSSYKKLFGQKRLRPKYQEFPVDDKSPKGLSRFAFIISNWIKEKMKEYRD